MKGADLLAADEILLRIGLESWQVLGQMAPYLLFGFLVAGLLSVGLSPAWLERHLGGRGMGPVWKSALFGVPLPLCSCGVIPVGASLRRHGASPAATTAFLLSTPQTGVDSILVTYAMLGPLFAIYRPVAALLTGLLGGALVLLGGRGEGGTAGGGGPAGGPDGEAGAACTDGCCAAEGAREGRLLRALRYGFVTLPRDIGTALLFGVVLAGVLTALVPADSLGGTIGGGALSILIMMAAGIPLYVCATASVPIAAGLMHVGASAGAAFAFLVAGPATNAATVTTLWKVLGPRTTFVYLGTVAVSALGCGLLLDWLLPVAAAAVPALGGHVHPGEEGGLVGHVSAVLLIGVVGWSLWSRQRAGRGEGGSGMSETSRSREQVLELVVDGMSCSHCADSVRRAMSEVPGVERAEVLLEQARARVRGRDLDPAQLIAAVGALGYRARPADQST
jgi:uncharacterized membrane protein YraQ (UPF0718 family)/copper chaperone CopZ